MNLPEPVATQPSLEQFRGGTARISGSLVPELVFDLDGSDGIFFEHHTLLWKDAGLNIELTIEGAQRPLPHSMDLSAFRIVQEALTNVIKHADGARATVTLLHPLQQLQQL